MRLRHLNASAPTWCYGRSGPSAARHLAVAVLTAIADQLADKTLIDYAVPYHYGAEMEHPWPPPGGALNLSEVENQRHKELNSARALTDRIEVVDGSFEDIPYPDDRVDVIWSQDAFLHSGNRVQVLEEIARVLRPGGHLIFTDPMAVADGGSTDVLQPILDRIHLDDMGSPGFYTRELNRLGFTAVDDGFEEHRQQLVNHYTRVLEETKRQEAEGLARKISHDYLAQMKKGLGHWIDGGREKHLTWGIFHFRLDADG
ncbi:methyltransferase domain-containing protein [Streptomyces piniterrae]|nr:methyltransferase domain-containing protein [Streptomyces piniterrae]